MKLCDGRLDGEEGIILRFLHICSSHSEKWSGMTSYLQINKLKGCFSCSIFV